MATREEIRFVGDPEVRRKIVNRLRRAQGQLTAVVELLETDVDCKNVMQQLSAVSKAIDRAGFLVISNTLKECLVADNAESAERAVEIEKMFLSLA